MLKVWYLCISTIQSICVVPNMVVLFSSLISCFPIMLVRHFLNDFKIVSVDPIITFITFVFTFHMHCISIVRSSYFRIFQACFVTIFLPLEILTSIDIHVPFSLLWIITSSLCGSVGLHLLLFVTTNFSTCAYQCSLISPPFSSVCCSVVPHTLYCVSCVLFFASTEHADIMCSTVSSDCLQNLHMLSVSVCNILPHDIWFAIPVLWYYYFTFSFSFQISPRQPQESDFANQLSIYTSNTLARHYFASRIF